MGCVSSKGSLHTRTSGGDETGWDGQIRPIDPWEVSPAITTEQLNRLRKEFWETRVEGRPEMWQALRFAAEAESPELCNETLKAAGLRPANKRGTLATTYDERGAMYEVPMFALLAPANVDSTPACEEFKDAARAVAEYIESHSGRGAGGRM